MLDRLPTLVRWLAWGILAGSFLGAGGRLYFTGEGVRRDQELFFGLLKTMPPAGYWDVSIIIFGVLVAAYLFVFSFSLQRLLLKLVRPFWLHMHLALTLLLLLLPFYCFTGWQTLDGPPTGYVGRLLPVLDDLTRHDFRITLEMDFWLAEAVGYGLLLNTVLLLYGFFQEFITKQSTSMDTTKLDDHLLN